MHFRSNLIPLSSVERTRKFVKAKTSNFARDLDVVEVAGNELGDLVTAYPLCFYFQGQQPVVGALFTLMPGTNFFVLPSGAWAANYVPTQIRTWPFALLAPTDENVAVFCIEESGLDSAENEGLDNMVPLFGEDDEPATALRLAKESLETFYASLKSTRRAAALLHEHELLEPWPLALKRDGVLQQLNGLWHVNEAAIRELEPRKLSELAAQGALALAYAALLSESRLDMLQAAATEHARTQEAKLAVQAELREALGDRDTQKLDFGF